MTSRVLWRSLDELDERQDLAEELAREFPQGAAELRDPLTRRAFLRLMGASLALAGLSACGRPRGNLVPYVAQPEPEDTPGRPRYFATAMPLGGYGIGLLAEGHAGRPTKVEGNPDHPASLGATDLFAQASVLGLYDPGRAQAVTVGGRAASWEEFQAAARAMLAGLPADGAGLRLLTGAVTSPSLAAQIQGLLDQRPGVVWHQYEPLARDNVGAGARLAFGQDVATIYRFDRASRIVSLDADFLTDMPGSVAYARQFAATRRVAPTGQPAMSRLYVAESVPTSTGAMADERVAARPAQIEPLARALAGRLGVAGVSADIPAELEPWLTAAAADLRQAGAGGLVLAGVAQPPAVHALAHAINAAIGALGSTALPIAPVEARPESQMGSLADLAAAMGAGQVQALIIIEQNPALTAPADLGFAELLARLPFSALLSQHYDETAAYTRWHIPASHYLEQWGDVRAYDGTASIIQPLIEPLYQSRGAHDILALLAGDAERSDYEIVRGYWQGRLGGDFEAQWVEILRGGVVPGTAAPPAQVAVAGDLAARIGPAPPPAPAGLEIRFGPDLTRWDGRFAGNAWLQELPNPITTVSWDNPALIAPATAARLGLESGDLVDLTVAGRALRIPLWLTPGMAAETIGLSLGYGGAAMAGLGVRTGFNTYQLRGSGAPWLLAAGELTPSGERYELASVQSQDSLEGRDILRYGTLAEYAADPAFARHAEDETLPVYQAPGAGADELGLPTLLPEYDYPGHAWGMSIDLNVCIGCRACTIACQAENNIPVVGKDGVLASRIMHWIKVDRYYVGDADNPETLFQPRPCMHCEKAPCELVCPVAATVHDDEGLNQMVYNRCIGTRYCSNNCPYKVRRFNFFDYKYDNRRDIPLLSLAHNPEVTVRERGVMEKCTYCVQRIERARIEARLDGRQIGDGEVVTACQQACPTQAIVFGDINSPASAVTQLKLQPRTYGMLADLGTQPRTTYMARLRNPNS